MFIGMAVVLGAHNLVQNQLGRIHACLQIGARRAAKAAPVNMKLRQIEAIVFFISFILSIPRRKAGQEVSIPHPERLPRLMRCRRQRSFARLARQPGRPGGNISSATRALGLFVQATASAQTPGRIRRCHS